MTRRSRRKYWKWIAAVLFVLVAGGTWLGMRYYRYLYHRPTAISETAVLLYIPTGAGFDQVVDSLKVLGVVEDEKALRWVAGIKKYDDHVKPGRYAVEPSWSNDELIGHLRSGEQAPVRVVLQEVRTLDELAALLDKYLEPETDDYLQALTSDSLQRAYGLDSETMMTAFIPNTYEFYWNTGVVRGLDRLHKETDRFWSGKRSEQAEKIGMERAEVYTLASIVYAETKKADEAPAVAGLYMNRIHKGMRLESDPTLKYALGDFTIRRILNRDKEVDSPYNTYKIAGLPPGPINMPPIAWIDAVLQYQKHDYLFMCAREDFSGYHRFARTYPEHLRNARAYQKALNSRNIYR